MSLTEIDQAEYLGKYFVNTPEHFEIFRGERKQLKRVTEYVNFIFDREGLQNGSLYFASLSPTTEAAKHPVEKEIKVTSETHFFLRKLVSAADKNVYRKSGGFRYDSDVKMFTSYLRMIAGPLAYDTLHRNLPHALPSLSSTNRYIQKSNCHVTEGILRAEELLQYLNARKLKPIVSISEDATRINGRIQYDSRTNQILGFPLPISDKNGMPIPFSYKARSATEILQHFTNNDSEASLVNVVMAQPISDVRAPPFCLLVFSTDNKYNSRHVHLRWKFICDNLQKVGIKTITLSSDSDPKYNSAMKSLSMIGVESNYFTDCDWFSCGDLNISENAQFCVQDVPHIGTKLRCLLLKTLKNPKKLPFGKKFYIQQAHIAYLLNKFTKDKHNLTASIIYPVDRQNFEETVLRICDTKVTDLLRSSVIGSQATIKFLEIMKAVIDSYMDIQLTPIKRIEKIWYAVFILRIWRNYIVSTKTLSLKENFLSANCYTCIELNAHSLVLIILHLRKSGSPEHFLPFLMMSQPCECQFRQIRSFTSTYSTVVNCSVKEFLSRISKIQLQNNIACNHGSNYQFPRLGNASRKAESPLNLPTLDELFVQIENCKRDALHDAIQIGLITAKQAENFDFACKISPYNIKSPGKARSEKKSRHPKPVLFPTWRGLLLKNFAEKFSDRTVDQNSPYVELSGSNKRIIVKKTSLCWLLKRDSSKMSSDRLLRVQQNRGFKSKKPLKTPIRKALYSIPKSKKK